VVGAAVCALWVSAYRKPLTGRFPDTESAWTRRGF